MSFAYVTINFFNTSTDIVTHFDYPIYLIKLFIYCKYSLLKNNNVLNKIFRQTFVTQ